MEYEKIRELMSKEKRSHPNEGMNVFFFGKFAVMSSDKVAGILVDREIAEKVANRKWCIERAGYPLANIQGEQVRLFDCVMALNGYEKPNGCYVDHINQDKLDNRLINLRFVSPTESSRNMPMRNDNTSGFTGVSRNKCGTYRAYITVDKKRIDIGTYRTIEEAVKARLEAENIYGFKTRPGTVKELCESRLASGKEEEPTSSSKSLIAMVEGEKHGKTETGV